MQSMNNITYSCQSIVDEIEDLGIVIFDVDGTIQGWNKGAEQIKGYTAEEVIGRNFGFLLSEEDLAGNAPEQLLKEAVNTGKARYEGWAKKNDGTTLWCKVVITPLYDANHQLTGFSEVIKDLTVEKQTEQQIELQRTNLDVLINNNTSDLIWSVDKNYHLIASNKQFDELVKVLSGKLIYTGSSILDAGFGEQRLIKFKRLYDVAFTGEIAKDFEFTDTPVDFYTEISAYPIWRGAEIIGAACFANDITERVLSENRIKESERKFRSLIEHDSDGISILSKSGDLMYISPGGEKVLGYPESEAKQMNLSEIVHPQDMVRLQAMMQESLAKPGIPIKGIVSRTKHKNGNWIWLNSTFTNLLNDPAVNGFVHNFRDITVEKVAEQKIMHANRLYAFISQINQTIVQVRDKKTVFKEACRIALEFGMFKAAWIGIFDRGINTISITEGAGILPEDVHLLTNAYCQDNGPQHWVLSTGGYYICNDIINHLGLNNWKPFAIARGYNSCMVLPIKKSGDIIGSFNLYSEEVDFFNSKEISLLEEATNDISFALDIFEKENQRTQSELKLKHKELRLSQAQTVAHLGSWELDFTTDLAIWSEEYCRIFGVDPADNIRSYESWTSFIHPEDMPHVVKTVADNRNLLNDHSFNHRIIRKDGTIRYLQCHNYFEFDDSGKVSGLYGISHDITEIKEIEAKLIVANRLYSFTSHINQTIVHVNNEQALFNDVCRIAVQIGKFDLAWIGEIKGNKVNLVAEHNATKSDRELYRDLVFDAGGLTAKVVTTGAYNVINSFDKEPVSSVARQYARSRGFKSAIALPMKKYGQTLYTLNLFSLTETFFDAAEIVLLEEAAADISFALDVFDKEQNRIKAEAKLKHSELRLKQAQAIGHIGSWELNFANGNAIWSEEALNIYGIPIENHKHSFESWMSYIHPDDRGYVQKITDDANKNLNNIAFFHRIVRKDREVRYIYSQAEFEYDNNGQPVGLNGVCHDVTGMKQSENALKQSQANLSLIVDLIPSAIFAKDPKGRFLFVNKSFADLYGVSPEHLISNSVEETLPSNNELPYFMKQDLEVITTGQPAIIPELQFTDYTGSTRTFYTTKVPYTIPGTNEKAVLGIARDITLQKQTEIERTKIVADIVQRNKDLEQFSYIVSHNLRSPVANIMGITDLLQNTGNSADEQNVLLGALSTSAQKLDGVIRDINLVLQATQEVNENRETVCFYDLLKDIKLSISYVLKSEDVEIKCDFSQVNELKTLKSYLYSIFLNLISNSIKYRQLGIPPVIEITSIQQKNGIGLMFKDNGMGIDMKQNHGKIFGLYKRFHDHTDGKGMGLYMVKTQVERLGGSITVDSEVDKGTTFKISFDNL